jgi:translation initiation factor 6 (eIF-6)
MFVMGCFGPLIAIFVRDTLHASTNTFGFASAMIGVGLLAGVTVLSAAAKKLRNTVLVYVGLGGIAFGRHLMGAAPHVVTTIVGCFLTGFAAGGIIRALTAHCYV